VFWKQNGIVPVVSDVLILHVATCIPKVVVRMMATRTNRRIVGPPAPARAVSAGSPSSRWHGSLASITDSERRALRPIDITAHEAAVRTGDILTGLFALPSVHIFQGVRPTTVDLPRIPHAVSAGRQVVLVESVAWPPGRYVVTVGGRIYCDGTYIGQSARQLMAAVRSWRESLPSGHRVIGLVVVHSCAEGELALPRAVTRDIAWTHAGDAVAEIRARLPRRLDQASVRAVAALIAATAEEENR